MWHKKRIKDYFFNESLGGRSLFESNDGTRTVFSEYPLIMDFFNELTDKWTLEKIDRIIHRQIWICARPNSSIMDKYVTYVSIRIIFSLKNLSVLSNMFLSILSVCAVHSWKSQTITNYCWTKLLHLKHYKNARHPQSSTWLHPCLYPSNYVALAHQGCIGAAGTI